MDKKIKEAVADWLPDDINAIPLRMWDPTDNQILSNFDDIGVDEQAPILDLGFAYGPPVVDSAAGSPAPWKYEVQTSIL